MSENHSKYASGSFQAFEGTELQNRGDLGTQNFTTAGDRGYWIEMA